MSEIDFFAPPKTMSSLILEAPGQLYLREVPIPTIGPGELLVQVKATTTCGTDLKAYVRGHPKFPMPGPIGHEYSGVVVAAGEGALFQPGDAIMGVHSAPCQQCYWCLHGQENLCETIMSTMVLGSYAQYLRIPARIAKLNVFAKPDDILWEIASLLEPFACVAQGISLLPLRHDSSVLVIGPGAIGLLFVAGLKASGIHDVTLAGRNQSRLAIGEQFGANTISYSKVSTARTTRFDVVIECTGQVEVWEKSVDFARVGGTVMMFGGCAGGTRVSFDTHRLHYDQITLLSPFHFGTAAVRLAREWILSKTIDLAPIITGERSLTEGAAVFEDLRAGKGVKYVFKP